MSPPAGDIYRSWLRVCPSVPSVTLSLSWPYLLESYMYNYQTFFPNNILTEVVQQKIKFNILKFWPKNTFKICVLSGPYLSNYTL